MFISREYFARLMVRIRKSSDTFFDTNGVLNHCTFTDVVRMLRNYDIFARAYFIVFKI